MLPALFYLGIERGNLTAIELFCTGMHSNLVTSALAPLIEQVHPRKADMVRTRGANLSASTLDSRFCPQVIVHQRLLADFPLSE